jgi:hypothetical protein
VKTYQVLVFPRAALNIDAILASIAARSPRGAKSWLAAFEDARNGLSRD